MRFITMWARFCLIYILVSTNNGNCSAIEPLSSSPLSLSSSSTSSSSGVTKGCSDCVLVKEEALLRLLEMTNAMMKGLQPQESEEPDSLFGASVGHLPSKEDSSEGLDSCNQRLLLTLLESEAKILQLRRELHKQKQETTNCKDEVERQRDDKEQVVRDFDQRPQHHHHHPRLHHHQQQQSSSTARANFPACENDPTAIQRSDLEDMKQVMLNAISDVRRRGRSDLHQVKEVVLDDLMDIRDNKRECKNRITEKQKEGFPPRDCYDLFEFGGKKISGIYTIYPQNTSEAHGVTVWCDMEYGDDVEEGGGWTVILQRRDLLHQIPFNRTWEDYRNGFGDPESEYWIGNSILHQLTTLGKPQVLRIDMEDFDEIHKFASYGKFSVGGEEENFPLTVGLFSATSSVSSDSFEYHNGQQFSTYERDNDQYTGYNCVVDFGGGGFWWKNCLRMNPTGPIRGKGKTAQEMSYKGFSSDYTTLKELTMKIKPWG